MLSPIQCYVKKLKPEYNAIVRSISSCAFKGHNIGTERWAGEGG